MWVRAEHDLPCTGQRHSPVCWPITPCATDMTATSVIFGKSANWCDRFSLTTKSHTFHPACTLAALCEWRGRMVRTCTQSGGRAPRLGVKASGKPAGRETDSGQAIGGGEKPQTATATAFALARGFGYTDGMAEPPKPKLRWFQYSLRSLLLFVTACAIACSWLAVTIQSQRRQGAAAEAIKKAGGKVESEQTWLGRLLRDDSLVNVTAVDLSGGNHRRRAGASPRVESTPKAVPRRHPSHRCRAGASPRVESTPRAGPSQHQSHRRRAGASPRIESTPRAERSTTPKSPMPGWCISKG